jgi:tetratricopeptide (TPR) repeat protein
VSGDLFETYKAALRRGHLATIVGRLDEALDAYREASELVPERSLPLASQGTVLHRLDRWAEAAERFEQALRLSPDDEATLRARAAALEERRLRAAAAADYERLAFVLDVAGRGPEAADAARKAAELEPTAPRLALADRLAATAARKPDASPDALETRRRGMAALEALGRGAYDDLPYASEQDTAATEGAGPAAPDGRPGPGSPADLASAEAAWPGITEERLAEAIAALDAPAAAGAPDMEAGAHWPGIDLPSPPPAPLVGPPPDPERLVAEADARLARGERAGVRDLLLTAARVHREAGRLDAALEVCLQLLAIAPGDPQVHLAIANLQLDRGWTGVATEKLDLLIRLTALTGDTQAEADVHGLASERLRDDPGTPAVAG